MPKNVARHDDRFEKAVKVLKKYPNIKLPDAMKLADFNPVEQKDRAKQMVLRRLLTKMGGSNVTPPPTTVVDVSVSSAGTEMSSVSDITDKPSMCVPEIKRIRMPTRMAQIQRASNQQQKLKINSAFKRATTMYNRERQKDDGLSARAVVECIEKDTGVKISIRTIQKKIKAGDVGTSPLRRGPKGNIPDHLYRNLCIAYESFAIINQINGTMYICRPKVVGPLLQQVIYGHSDNWEYLFKRVQKDTAANLRRQKAKNSEERRNRWTTEGNIAAWFDNWENDLVKLGFATRDETTGEVHISPEQLGRIANFDETCLLLSGSDTNRGGRPDAIIYDPRFPVVGLTTSKSSLSSTLITGSTAAGEALPPHIQFQTKAKSNDTERISIDVIEHCPKVKGKFGCPEQRLWPVTFGMNENGGMNEEEFEKYLRNSILPLFPDAKDKPGLRVILKVDSGPGRTNLKLLATLRLLGFILYPCVPNTTHVTQETDQCYGPFKTQFLINLEQICVERLKKNKSLSLSPSMVGLPLFGGIDSETCIRVATSAFQKGFVRSRCLAAWKKVGAATEDGITRACLSNPQVLKEIGDNEDTDRLYYAIQKANDLAVHALNIAGYEAERLEGRINKKEVEETICVPIPADRLERLANARGHGGRFHATKGIHLTADDIFISIEMKDRKKAIEEAEKDKKRRKQHQTHEEKALEILSMEGVGPESYSVPQLNSLLAWHQVDDLPPKAKKADKLERWKDIIESQMPAPHYARWTDEDERKLNAMKCDDISIGDTAYGREVALKKRELEAVTDHLSREERDTLRQKLNAMDAAEANC